MADLIDRDVFILSLKTRRATAYLSELNDCDTEEEKCRIDDEMYYSTQSFIDVMQRQPTVDAVPVVHGHWIHTGLINAYGGHQHKCSVCGYELMVSPMCDNENYCCNCGSKMDVRKGEQE